MSTDSLNMRSCSPKFRFGADETESPVFTEDCKPPKLTQLERDGDNKETLSEVPNRYVRKWGQQNDCDRKYLSRWFSISYQDDSRAAAGHPEEAHRRLKLSSSPDSKDMVSFPTAVLQRATSLYSDTDPPPR